MAILAVVTALLIGAASVSGRAILGGNGDERDTDNGDRPVRRSSSRSPGRERSQPPAGRSRARRPAARRSGSIPAPVCGCSPMPIPAGGSHAGGAPARSAGSCRLVVKSDTRVSALFERVADPRRVTVRTIGSGVVVSRPAGISCGNGGACRATFKRSSDVRLTAAASGGHRFAGWSGDCQGDRCEITGLTATASVSARASSPTATRGRSRCCPAATGGSRHQQQHRIDCGGVQRELPAWHRLRPAAIPSRLELPGWRDPASHRRAAPRAPSALYGRAT